jgi:branched-chain amino acid transport system permease protein
VLLSRPARSRPLIARLEAMDIGIYLITGLANGALYSLMALGLVLIYRTQSFVPFVNGEFFTAGAFIGLVLYKTAGAPYWLAFVLAIGGGGLIALLSERLMRPIHISQHLSLVLATAGMSMALQGAIRLKWGDDLQTMPPLFEAQSIELLGMPIGTQNLVIIAVTALIAAFMFFFLQYAKFGRQIRAVAENLGGAQLVGINPVRAYQVAWILAGAIGGAAGILAAPFMLLYPNMGAGLLIKGFAAAILGGLTSVPGALVGGLVIGVFEQLIARYAGTVYLEISAFVVIMIVLLVRPQGLFGGRAIRRV